MKRISKHPRPPMAMPPQSNLQVAAEKATESLAGQSAEQLAWLGATPAGDTWRISVLGEVFEVDISSGRVWSQGGGDVQPAWRILTLHYLDVRCKPPADKPEITFADLPAARSYAKVYQGRVIGRLCATAGRDLATLSAAVEAIGARPVDGGDAAFEIAAFPRIPLRVIWYAADEDFPPSATLLLGAKIESFLCVEDIVVLSECLVSRLSAQSS